jgi:4'-phosphopantetheinyl transferase EntD
MPGVLIDHRIIGPGDEQALLPEEANAVATSVIKVRRASGAARIVARRLLARLGKEQCALPKGSAGAPLWPEGIVGSLAHDDTVALAAVAMSSSVGALGVDIEPAEQPPFNDLLERIATPRERFIANTESYGGRLLFAAKEAVYKAVYPLDGLFLDHHDIEIDLVAKTGTVNNGRVLDLKICISSHIVVLAFMRCNNFGTEVQSVG